MIAYRRSFIATEGWPWLIGAVALTYVGYLFAGVPGTVPGALAVVALFLLFRDPERQVPPLPDAVLAPVDGVVESVERCRDELLAGDWWKIAIRVSRLGAYTARAPTEGTIGEITDKIVPGHAPARGMWLRTEEGDDIVLMFPKRAGRFGPAPFRRYGERVGQGQRFAWLRTAARAEVYVSGACSVAVQSGERAVAGITVLAEFPQKFQQE